MPKTFKSFLETYFPEAKRNGAGFVATCPVCNDELHITYTPQPIPLIKLECTKCPQTDIMQKMELTPEDVMLGFQKVKTFEDRKIDNTDLGNGYRFAKLHVGKCLYVHSEKCWFIWNGSYWERDQQENIKLYANNVIEYMIDVERHERAMDSNSGDVLRWAVTTKNGNHIEKMIQRAASLPEMKKQIKEFDQKRNLLCVRNGTIDLKTGELKPHNKEDYITHYIDIDYNPDAECPKYESFLEKIFLGRYELIEYIQVMCGYILTGEITEECLFFLYGTGSNGKSTFMNIMKEILGDFYIKLGTETILQHKQSGAKSRPYELAELPGKRLALVSEIGRDDRLKMSIIKDITHKDTIAARSPHGKPFNFESSHKVVLYGNHKPSIDGTDKGTWRTIRLIPFDCTISKSEAIPNFEKQLLEEREGILAYLVRGAIEYYANGLPESTDINDATKEYKNEQDLLSEFLQESCILDLNKTVEAKKLYEAYKAFCNKDGCYSLSKKKFYLALEERGGIRKYSGSKNKTMFQGICLFSDREEPEFENNIESEFPY